MIKIKGFYKTDRLSYNNENIKELRLALRSVEDFRYQDRKLWLLGKSFPLEIYYYALILNMCVQMCANKIVGLMKLTQFQITLSVH